MIAPMGGGARIWAIAGCLVIAVLACAKREAPRPASRLVTIGGAVTETVFALGRGDDVVAVDTSSTFPAEAATRAQVGYQRTLSAEPILALEPGLVLATPDAGPPAALAQLRDAGVRVVVVPAAMSPAEAAARIRAIGAAIDRAEAADALAAKVARDATAARDRASGAARPRVLFLFARGGGTVMVAGRATPAAAVIELAGGAIAVDADGYAPLSAEAAVASAPEVIVVPARSLDSLGGVDGVLALPGLAPTPAGRARRVVAIDDVLVLGFGPRLAEAIDTLSRALGGGEGA